MSWGPSHVCVQQDKPYVVLDFETTGLSAQDNRVIEIGAFRISPGATHTPHFQRLIRSPKPLSRRIVRLTGITDAMLETDGIDPAVAIRELVAFIGGDSIVAYNASFDLGFLNASCERHGVAVAARGGHSCALKLARRTWPEMPNHKLGSVWETLALVPAGPVPPEYLVSHRALGDAYRTGQIYQAAAMLHWEAQAARPKRRTARPATVRPRATTIGTMPARTETAPTSREITQPERSAPRQVTGGKAAAALLLAGELAGLAKTLARVWKGRKR